MDTGVDEDFYSVHQSKFCKDGLIDLTGYGIFNNSTHATEVLKILFEDFNSKRYCAYLIKYNVPGSWGNLERSVDAMKLAQRLKAKYLNFSSGGPERSTPEVSEYVTLLSKNTKLFFAAGNNGDDLDKDCNYFPPCYFKNHARNVYIVGAVDEQGNRREYSNYGSKVTHWRFSRQGTSFAAPVLLREVLNADSSNR